MINAIKYTAELEKAGFTPEQAKKSVDTWMTLINNNFSTKSDFREFYFANKSDLRELEFKLEQTSSKIIIQLGALMAVLMTIAVR